MLVFFKHSEFLNVSFVNIYLGNRSLAEICVLQLNLICLLFNNNHNMTIHSKLESEIHI